MISGNFFKSQCDIIIDEGDDGANFERMTETIMGDIRRVFVKTDYVKQFLSHNFWWKEEPYYLFTHNSDLHIDESYAKYIPRLPILMEHDKLVHWYAQNVRIEHERITPIPIGIANPKWPHGNVEILESSMKAKLKGANVYCNINPNTNPSWRQSVLNCIPIYIWKHTPILPFDQHLSLLGNSMFSICPKGNGDDTHRVWESLYLRTIPVVDDTLINRYFVNQCGIPMIIVPNSDWNNFDYYELNWTTYERICNQTGYSGWLE